MNGGLASRSAAPEPASPARAAPAAPAPVRALPAPRVLDAEVAPAPTTRARLEASFAPAAPEVSPPTTTRERIVNRARAEVPAAVVALAPPTEEAPEPVVVAAPVVDLAEERARRRPAAEIVAAPEGPLAPVVALEPTTGPPARAPPAAAPEVTEAPVPGDQLAGDALARAPPEAASQAAAVEAPAAAPSPEAAPEGAPAEEAAPEAAEPEAPSPEAEAAPVEAPPPAPPVVTRNPQDDPAFQAMTARVDRNAARAKHHQPSDVAAATAQGASEPDVQKDVRSQAAGEQVGVMGSKEPGEFDPAAFKAAVKKAVEGMAPPATLEEADEFEESGKAAGARDAIHGLVTTGNAASQRDIKVATEATPTSEGRKPKPVTPMVNDDAGPPLPGVDAESALPGLRPDSEIDLSSGPLAVATRLAEAKVTEQQLATGNEPAFDDALERTQEVRDHAATAPAGYREQEAVVLAAGRAGAQQVAATQTEAMHGSRIGALDVVLGAKETTKVADQKLYDDVHQGILDIHAATQAEVKELLSSLDGTVETMFTEGEATARKTFETNVDNDMREYKRKRYKGFWGKGRWLKDKVFDLPDEVNRFYERRRGEYLAAMDQVIEAIAVVVGLRLGAAHARILAGRDKVTAFVEGLPESTRKLGRDAAADLDHKFDDLASDVDAKRDELVDTVARLYVDSRNQLDERIKELKEANKGLVSRAIDAVVGVLKTIYELGRLLLRVLLKAASAIGDILAHPIRFLGNLVDAVKGGLERFVTRIGDHLQKAMLDLLFGELGSAGITMPKQLDFAGILDLVLQVLGLSYQDIRARLVKRFGEDAVARMEETVDVFKTILRDGLGGLWTWVAEKLGDLEDLVIGKVKEYIVERVIKAGIGYIVALLNPAAAFIKACQGIYQIVMFVVERARQLATFVESILDSISAIAQGNVGAAIERIERALADGLSLAIAFLARLANLGALSEKVRSIIAAIRRPVTRAVDLVIFGAADVYRRTAGRAIAFGKEKARAGREWAKGKLDAGRALALRKVERAPVRLAARELPREPPAAADPQRAEDEALASPIRLAEDTVDVAPDERHTVFAQLASGGEIDIGISSTPQLVTDLIDHFEPRIGALPVTAPARLPKGGEKGDQPRAQAEAAVRQIRKAVTRLDLDFENDFDARRALHRTASFKGFAGVYKPDPGLTSRLAKLGDAMQVLLRLFYAYEKPRFARVADEPADGQKLSARIWARPIPGRKGQVLPEGGARGLDPTRPVGDDFGFIAPDPDLAAQTRGADERSRGVVHLRRRPGELEPAVVVRSWAVGGTPDRGSNASHTETHFYHWLVAQGEEFHARVTAIELRSVLSPCGGCTEILTGIARLVRRRPPGMRPASLILYWDQVYGNEEGDKGPAAATFQRHVVSLGDAGWLVHGPTPPA